MRLKLHVFRFPSAGFCLLLFTGLMFYRSTQLSGQQRVKISASSAADSLFFASLVDSASANDRIRSLIIRKHDRSVLEAYFKNQRPGQAVNIKSVSKSLLAIMAGIAVDQKKISINEPVHTLLPSPVWNAEPEKKAIMFSHLLTMSAGWKSTSYQYTNWTNSSDWVEFILRQPMVHPPGETMLYSSGTAHVCGVALAAKTGPLKPFVEKNLFNPMGIVLYGWDRDPKGYYFGGNNMALLPSDLAKIGQLVLNKGVWKGKQLVSEAWIQEMTSPAKAAEFSERPARYGYFWWHEHWNGVDIHYAWGYGGQYIFVVPAQKLVVVVTSVLLSSRSIEHNNRIIGLMEKTIRFYQE